MASQLFGRSLELHPVIVLLALAFWFSIWGVVGAILSIPVTAVLRIVLSHVNHPYAKVIIRLLEGKRNTCFRFTGQCGHKTQILQLFTCLRY